MRRTEIGDRVRQLRAGASLTQEELAARAGIGRVTLAKLEAGTVLPSVLTVISLAIALNTTTDSILRSGP